MDDMTGKKFPQLARAVTCEMPRVGSGVLNFRQFTCTIHVHLF